MYTQHTGTQTDTVESQLPLLPLDLHKDSHLHPCVWPGLLMCSNVSSSHIYQMLKVINQIHALY